MSDLIGTKPEQISTNSMLGSAAFVDIDALKQLDELPQEEVYIDTIGKPGIHYKMMVTGVILTITTSHVWRMNDRIQITNCSGNGVIGTAPRVDFNGYNFHGITPGVIYLDDKTADVDIKWSNNTAIGFVRK